MLENNIHTDIETPLNPSQVEIDLKPNLTGSEDQGRGATVTGNKQGKKSKKKKKPKKGKRKGGIKSQPLKSLTHPLDRSIAVVFVVTVFFTLLAIISGLPIVAALFALLLPAIVIKRILACHLRTLPSTTTRTSPLESHWLSNGVKNNNKQGVTHVLLYVDKAFTLDQLRDVMMARVLQKPEFSRFRSILVYKGLSRSPFWVRLPFNKFSIEELITEDETIHSKEHLKGRLVQVMACPMAKQLPLWQIRYCYLSYLNQVVLILRVHQSVCDGIGLLSVLVEQLADQAPPPTTTFIRTCQGTMTATTALFKPRFGGINFAVNICRAIVVGPLTFILWIVWAFSRRKNNFLKSFRFLRKVNGNDSTTNSRTNSVSHSSTNSKGSSVGACDPRKSIYWTTIDLPKVYRVKQVTRSCFNDVILAAISGSIRQYLVTKALIPNPPNLTVSIPVDLRGPESDSQEVGVNYVLLTSPLPIATEGAIPRLWDIRALMEELKSSADPAVAYGAHYMLTNLLPTSVARFLLNLVHRNSSVCLSNLQGPDMELTIGTHRLRKMQYFFSPPPNISIAFNVITYNKKIFVGVSTTCQLIPCAKSLTTLFREQLDQLCDLLSRRRVPGESRHKRKGHHVVIDAPLGVHYGDSMAAYNYTSEDLGDKLRLVQYELNQLTAALDTDTDDKEELSDRLEELKDEFSDLMKQIRRRKSFADFGHNIVINVEDGVEEEETDDDVDMDGSLRPAPRRFSLASRRGSVVSAIGLGTGRRFSVTPPLLGRHSTSSPEPSSSPDRNMKEESLV